MLKIFLSLAIVTMSNTADAQINKLPAWQLTPDKADIWKKIEMIRSHKKMTAFVGTENIATLQSVVTNGKVYRLPQDKMPCFVPDKTYAAQMPVKSIIPDGTMIPTALLLKQRIIPE